MRQLIQLKTVFFAFGEIVNKIMRLNAQEVNRFLRQYYNLSEIRQLSFDLDLDFDNIAGKSKDEKALSLVIHLQNRGRLNDLIPMFRGDRPNLDSEIQKLFVDSYKESPPIQDNSNKFEWDNELKLIRGQLQRRRVVIFLGPDLDKDLTDIPSRQQLSDSLAIREGLEPEQPLSAVAQQVMQYGNRFGITSFLREQMDSTGKTPQKIHHQIVCLARENNLKTIITTTYDSMLEIAFRQSRFAINTAVVNDDLQFNNQDIPLLIKLYGDWRQPASLIITQQDENQLLRGRLLEKKELVNEVKRAFRLNTILFIGLNLQDITMTSLFDEFAGNQFQLPAYAVWSDLTTREVEAWRSNRGLTIIDAGPISFLRALQQ